VLPAACALTTQQAADERFLLLRAPTKGQSPENMELSACESSMNDVYFRCPIAHAESCSPGRDDPVNSVFGVVAPVFDCLPDLLFIIWKNRRAYATMPPFPDDLLDCWT
jgi:hypothetical protein